MAKKYSESFKLQAIEKVLNRSSETTIEEILSTLGVSRSAMSRWVKEASSIKTVETNKTIMPQEKRPQDLTLKERLKHIKECGNLEEAAISRYCREHGFYPHHLEQWEQNFIQGYQGAEQTNKSELRNKKVEIKELKKEISRKDKALAETAALLVLQKKVHEIWGSDEDN